MGIMNSSNHAGDGNTVLPGGGSAGIGGRSDPAFTLWDIWLVICVTCGGIAVFMPYTRRKQRDMPSKWEIQWDSGPREAYPSPYILSASSAVNGVGINTQRDSAFVSGAKQSSRTYLEK